MRGRRWIDRKAAGEAVSDRAVTSQARALQGSAQCDLRQRATQNCDRQNSEICFERASLRSLRSKLYRSADAETRCREISLVNCTVADTFAGLINLFGRMALRSTLGSLLESIVASGISM